MNKSQLIWYHKQRIAVLISLLMQDASRSSRWEKLVSSIRLVREVTLPLIDEVTLPWQDATRQLFLRDCLLFIKEIVKLDTCGHVQPVRSLRSAAVNEQKNLLIFSGDIFKLAHVARLGLTFSWLQLTLDVVTIDIDKSATYSHLCFAIQCNR